MYQRFKGKTHYLHSINDMEQLTSNLNIKKETGFASYIVIVHVIASIDMFAIEPEYFCTWI